MSFWISEKGSIIDGSEENSHVMVFKIIPDGTTAPAAIKKAELTSYNGEQFYQITYKIIDGDFKDNEVRQKIYCFGSDIKKRDRNINMLLRLYNLSEVTYESDEAPKTKDLYVLINKIIGIRIQEWSIDGKEGNYVSQIHRYDTYFKTASGKKIQHILNSTIIPDMGDIPF